MRKKIIALLSTAILLFPLLLSSCSLINKEEKDKEKLTAHIENNNANNYETAKIILKHMGKLDEIEKNTDIKLSFLKGSFSFINKNETAFAININNEKSYVALYDENMDYICSESFFDISDIQLIKAFEDGIDMIVIREYITSENKNEKASYIRIYKFLDNSFDLKLSTLENYKATWKQEINPKDKSDLKWYKVTQNSDLSVIRKDKLTINLDNIKDFSISDYNGKEIPYNEMFSTAESARNTTSYYWSNYWDCFILGEGKINKNTESAAILNDFSSSPHSLYYDTDNSLRIKREDGTIEIIDNSLIETSY